MLRLIAIFQISVIFLTSSNLSIASKCYFTDTSKVESFDSIILYSTEYGKYTKHFDTPYWHINDLKILDFANKWLGTRYEFGGEGHRGIDCSALTQKFSLSFLNAAIPRTAYEQFLFLKESISFNHLKPGDLLFFHTTRPGISHVGIYLINHKFLHASIHGVTIDDLRDPYYKKALRAAKRLPDYESKSQFINFQNIRVINISGKYKSEIILKVLNLDKQIFDILNPSFDLLVWDSYMLRLPKEKMELFISLKPKILEESIASLMNFRND
jgi:hypothetical protein